MGHEFSTMQACNTILNQQQQATIQSWRDEALNLRRSLSESRDVVNQLSRYRDQAMNRGNHFVAVFNDSTEINKSTIGRQAVLLGGKGNYNEILTRKQQRTCILKIIAWAEYMILLRSDLHKGSSIQASEIKENASLASQLLESGDVQAAKMKIAAILETAATIIQLGDYAKTMLEAPEKWVNGRVNELLNDNRTKYKSFHSIVPSSINRAFYTDVLEDQDIGLKSLLQTYDSSGVMKRRKSGYDDAFDSWEFK